MIRFAAKNEEEILKSLYLECFNDSKAFTAAVFSQLYRPGDCLVWDEGGTPVAMLFILNPLDFVGYIFGACTRKDMRRRGVMTAMVLRAEDEMRARGYTVSILIPGNFELFKFYAKLGYKTRFFKRVDEYTAKPGKEKAVRLDCTDAKNMLYSSDGGGYFKSKKGRALVEIIGKDVVVRELIGDTTVLDAVASVFEVKTLVICLPSPDDTDQPRGMAKALVGEPNITHMLWNVGALYD